MRNPVTNGAAWFAIVSILTAAGCDRNLASAIPSAPSQVVAADVTGPTSVTGVAPATPTQSGWSQVLHLRGTGFRTGVSFVFADPNGAQVTMQGSDVQNVQPTSADVSVTLSQAGRYQVAAIQANAEASAPFLMTVLDRRSAGAVIDSVSPASTTRSDAAQTVSLAGRHFDPCLTVHIIDPESMVNLLDASRWDVSTETLLEFPAVFKKAGTYTLSLWTNVGPASSSVVVVVR